MSDIRGGGGGGRGAPLKTFGKLLPIWQNSKKREAELEQNKETT